jgi:hypothetical protein
MSRLEMLDKPRRVHFLLSQHWRQVLREVTDVPGQCGLALYIEGVGNHHPMRYDGPACFDNSRTNRVSERPGLVELLHDLRHCRP